MKVIRRGRVAHDDHLPVPPAFNPQRYRYPVTHSCYYCKDLSLTLEYSRPEGVEVTIDLGVNNCQQATSAARNGCQFFATLLHPYWPESPNITIRLLSQQQKWFMGGLSSTTIQRRFSVRFEGRLSEFPSRRQDIQAPYLPPVITNTTFQVFVYQDPNICRYFVRPPAVSIREDAADIYENEKCAQPSGLDVGSTDAFSTARFWFHECQRNHKGCQLVKKARRPKRLLELTGETIKMIINWKSPKYVALSYCWGGDQTTKLTKASFKQLKSGIHISDLSKSIQDAIKVTVELGMQYLWVDALCIIQDDTGDVFGELKNMPDIYGGAEVTIAAGNASSCNLGFLSHRIPEPMFGAEFRGPDGERGTILLQPNGLSKITRTSMSEGDEIDALHQRGWTLQEILFSRRYLYYGHQHVEWQCRCKSLQDGGTTASQLSRFSELQWDIQEWDDNSDTDVESFQKEWWDMIKEYSKRAVTVPADRLNAISGIAAHFANIYFRGLSDQYLAGLWRKTLPTDLLWASRQYNPESVRLHHRPESGIPSWSWASVDNLVGSFRPRLASPRVYINVLNVTVDTGSSPSPFAGIRSGEILLRGMVRQIKVLTSTLRDRLPGQEYQIHDSGFGVDITVIWDATETTLAKPESSTPYTQIWALRIETAPRSEEDMSEEERNEEPRFQPDNSIGLVLCKETNGDVFKRIGLMIYSPKKDTAIWRWEDSFQLKTLRLI